MRQDLFARLNSPYYIYSPPFPATSGGGKALHYLCHALNLAGEEAYVTDASIDTLRAPRLTQEIINAHIQIGRQPIVIYPEVISGNPMSAPHVVRYLLNLPGALNQEPLDWGKDDLIYAHREELIPPGMTAPLLATPLVNDQIFHPGAQNQPRRGTLVWINRYLNKGGTLDPLTRDATEISLRVPQRSAEELAALFRQSELLYTYEPSTTCYEALLCGCPVVYLPNPVSLANPMFGLGYLNAAGSAWGPSTEQLAHARATVHQAPEIYRQRSSAFWQQLDDFIHATQQSVHDKTMSTRTSQAQTPASALPRTTAPAAAMPSRIPGLLATPVGQSPQAKRKKRLLVYSAESTWSPCPQIRLIRPFAHLQEDWELVWGIQNGKLQTDPIDGADLIVLHRFTPGLMPISSLQAIFDLGKPVIYESDDLLNEIPHDHPEAASGASWKEGIEYTVRRAKGVVVSTQFLAEKYRQLNPNVHVLPNYIDYDIFYRPVPQRRDDKITIGLLGSSIQPSNFALVDQALRTLVERYGKRLHIYFVGWVCPKGWEHHPQTTFLSFVHEYVNYAEQLRNWNWDIALIPLASDEYNQCKSYIKWLDYSAAGIASIFSDVSVYNEVVTHDSTGLLMPNSDQAWLQAITLLIESPEKRHALASAGQQAIKAGYDLREKSALYNDVYGKLAS
ncbi:glycosyltransferase [Herbaspirillum sp. RV1423]|uniref:glycosyltransferase n=1 Tax=Herbaspirillum sp. RV1423 TaxID=1443993 RepID=UPI0004BAE10F|nr:glycosyltransferase [Herbaspirillum sp. RV1423]